MIPVGLLDSGLGPPLLGRALGACRFGLDVKGAVVTLVPEADPLGHGTRLAALILDRAPTARLLDAQVFDQRGMASAAAVACGLDWLVAAGARLVNMSFGLTHDRAVLADACARAIARGVLLVASVPAAGPEVYPAAYPGVVRVTGDGRCQGQQISHFGAGRAQFGASPRLEPTFGFSGTQLGGASIAAARITAEVAALLTEIPGLAAAEVVDRLAVAAAYRGPQREHLQEYRPVPDRVAG